MRAESKSTSERLTCDKRFVEETIGFVARMTRVNSVAFYVVDHDADCANFQRLNVSDVFHREYEAGMRKFDPFELHRVGMSSTRSAILTRSVSPAPEDQQYIRFLGAYGYRDAVEAVFRSDTQVLGGLSLLLADGLDVAQVACVVDAIQPYIEYNLRSYTGRSKSELRKELVSMFSLSARELDVVELMMKGETNGSIGSILHISVATVKSHVLKIFEKVHVPNRSSLVALLSEYGGC